MTEHKFLYNNASDRHQRLSDTYCLWEGRVVFINYFEDYLFTATRAGSTRQEQIDIRDNRFSAHPFSLGWFNQGDSAFYLSRNAYRTSKQGLVPRNLTLCEADGREVPTNGRIRILDALDYIVSGTYPSMSDAIRVLNGTKGRSVALSRTVALRTDEIGIIKVSHHTDTIGWYSRSEGFCRVPDSPKAVWYTKFLAELGCKIERGLEQ